MFEEIKFNGRRDKKDEKNEKNEDEKSMFTELLGFLLCEDDCKI